MASEQTFSGVKKGKGRAVETLEVENEEQRQARIHELFTRLDSSSSRINTRADRPFDFGDRKTFAVEPPTELLSRVQAFLPELMASTADLVQRARDDPTSVDIENIETDEQYIEMNLGLGVFEQRRGADSRPGAEASSSDSQSDDTDLDSEDEGSSSRASGESSDADQSSSEEDGSSSGESDARLAPPLSTRPIRPLPRRKIPSAAIVMLREDGPAAPTG
ncbi:hypothetical protein B0H21DRAFT_453410 [Amylocystis lapponica]|nr:hypothetical protein B0H21DRAFT_453410 [Amylocystis lapponica]